MDVCPTVKVKPWGKKQGAFVEINEEDFDSKKHEKLSAADLAKIEKAEAKGAEASEGGEAAE
jgi:hypothetical protein